MNEALKELKAAVQEADKEVTNAMDTEEAILEHLVDRFGNPIEMIRSREAEFASWKPCKGTYEQRRDWFAHARARLQNIIELCTEHEVLDHLYDSQLNRLFQQRLDEDSIDILMEIFMMSPQAAAPTSPTPSASFKSPILRGFMKCSITVELYNV